MHRDELEPLPPSPKEIIEKLVGALEPFADEINKEAFKTHPHWPDTQGFVGFKFKLGDIRKAAQILTAAQQWLKESR